MSSQDKKHTLEEAEADVTTNKKAATDDAIEMVEALDRTTHTVEDDDCKSYCSAVVEEEEVEEKAKAVEVEDDSDYQATSPGYPPTSPGYAPASPPMFSTTLDEGLKYEHNGRTFYMTGKVTPDNLMACRGRARAFNAMGFVKLEPNGHYVRASDFRHGDVPMSGIPEQNCELRSAIEVDVAEYEEYFKEMQSREENVYAHENLALDMKAFRTFMGTFVVVWCEHSEMYGAHKPDHHLANLDRQVGDPYLDLEKFWRAMKKRLRKVNLVKLDTVTRICCAVLQKCTFQQVIYRLFQQYLLIHNRQFNLKRFIDHSCFGETEYDDLMINFIRI